jgi:hypothetical protein
MANGGIVADGEERLVSVMLEIARREVEDEYAERLAVAETFLKRWRLHREMRREIERRARPTCSPETLF